MIRLQSLELDFSQLSSQLDGLPPYAIAFLLLWSLITYFMLVVPLLTGDVRTLKQRLPPVICVGAALYFFIWVGTTFVWG